MTDSPRRPTQGPSQIHAPLKAWFENKQAEPTPDHLIALVDELDGASQALGLKKAS